jgi:hypothetical protein
MISMTLLEIEKVLPLGLCQFDGAGQRNLKGRGKIKRQTFEKRRLLHRKAAA